MLLSGIKSKKMFLIVSIAIVCSIIVFLIILQFRYNQEMSLHFEDTNGDDKSLCRVTDDDIKNITHDYRSIKRNVTTKGTNTSGVSGFFKDYDNDYVKTTNRFLPKII